jgi:hypothetical protein
MTTVELLREARALIDTPEKWTQGAFARDGKGDRVDELDKRACRFCASGATSRVTGIKSGDHARIQGHPARDGRRWFEVSSSTTWSTRTRKSSPHSIRRIAAEEAKA